MLISFIHLLNCRTKYSIFRCTLGLLKIEDATFGKNSFRTQQNIWDGAFFAEKVNGVQPLVIFLDVWFCSKYSYGTVNCFAIRFILDICLGFSLTQSTILFERKSESNSIEWRPSRSILEECCSGNLMYFLKYMLEFS